MKKILITFMLLFLFLLLLSSCSSENSVVEDNGIPIKVPDCQYFNTDVNIYREPWILYDDGYTIKKVSNNSNKTICWVWTS